MGNLIGREKEVKELTELYIRFRRSLFPTHPSNIKQVLGILGVS